MPLELANIEPVLRPGQRVRVEIAMEGTVISSMGNAALVLEDGSVWAITWPQASDTKITRL